MISTSNRGWKQAAIKSVRCIAILSTAALLSTPTWAQSLQIVPSATKAAGTGANGFNGDSGTASSLNLSAPTYNAFDAQGNQYFSDTANNCIRKLDTGGNLSTVVGLDQAGPADTCKSSLNPTPTTVQGLLAPTGIALDAVGNLYVSDTGHDCVRRLPNGATGVKDMITMVGVCGGSKATSVVPTPTGLTLDAASNIFVSTSDVGINQVVRHLAGTASTVVCVAAGDVSVAAPTTCSGGTLPTLSKPSGLAFDPAGNLFIADTGNFCVRELTLAGGFNTPAGTCGNDGTGSSTPGFTSPVGLAFSQNGKLYITAGSNVFEFVMPGHLNLIAGLGNPGSYSSGQDGAAAVLIPLNSPYGVAVDPIGNPFVVDSQNNILRKLTYNLHFLDTRVGNSTAGQSVFFVIHAPVTLSTAVGSDYKSLSTTCTGHLDKSATTTPTTCGVSIAFFPTFPGARRSPLMLSDSTTNTTQNWGLNGIGIGAQATFPPGTINTILSSLANPSAVRLDSRGNVYLAEAGVTGGDVKVIAAGSTAAATLIAPGSGLITPTALALDAAGNIYIADSGAGKIFEFGRDAVLATFATIADPEALAFDAFDNLYVADDATHSVIKIYQGGQQVVVAGMGNVANANGVPAVQALLGTPSGLAVDSNGVLYIADSTGYRVYSVDTNHTIHHLVGNGTKTDTASGTALGTALQNPRDLALDPAGDVFIADGTGNRSILVYSASQQNPQVSTIAGTGTSGNAGDGGPSTKADLNNPISMALDGNASVYIVDAGNSTLRKIVYTAPVLDFGTIKAGDVSPVQTVTLWDTGNEDLVQVGSLLLSDQTNFTLNATSTKCGTTNLHGATCDYGFQFNPQAAGAYSATATLSDNAFDSPQIISLKGGATVSNIVSSTITTAPYIATYGTPYTWAAGVIGDGTHIPSGTLTFVINGAPLCPPSLLDKTIHASCSPSPTALAAGTYSMVINYSGDSIYASNSITAPATVRPAPVTITATSFTRPYGQLNPVLTGTITGVVTGETITATYSTTATQFSSPGSYPIVPIAAAGPGTALSNYAITIVNGTLTITQAGTVSIAVNNASRIYGTPNPPFSSTITNGANGDTITATYSTTAVLNSPVGIYAITATLSGASGGDYSGATVLAGTLTIAKAPTTLVLTTSSGVSIPGSMVTWNAAVTSPSQIVPDGIVTFADGGTMIGSGTMDATGHASFSSPALAAGSHTMTATYPGTIDFLGSAANIAQAVGVPGNFTITATPPYQEVKGAGSNVYQVTVNSAGGFFGDVTLSCSGLPKDAGCVFSPATVTLTAGSTAKVKLTTTTTLSDANTGAVAHLGAPGGNSLTPLLAWTLFPMQLSGAATLFAGALRRKRKQQFWKRLALLIPMVVLILGIAGCGCTVTQFHTYTITITGTATPGGSPLTQSTTVTLTAIQ